MSPCQYCNDVENCTKCVANTWLYNFRCVQVCPATYYNDSSGVCLACEDPCAECNSLTSCKTCATLYITGDQCVAAADCPDGTYANTTIMSCEPCNFPCLTCDANPDKCTTCENGYLYYSNLCVQSCPDGMYKNNIYCFDCVAPCSTCNSSTFCKSCATDYLYNGSCLPSD